MPYARISYVDLGQSAALGDKTNTIPSTAAIDQHDAATARLPATGMVDPLGDGRPVTVSNGRKSAQASVEVTSRRTVAVTGKPITTGLCAADAVTRLSRAPDDQEYAPVTHEAESEGEQQNEQLFLRGDSELNDDGVVLDFQILSHEGEGLSESLGQDCRYQSRDMLDPNSLGTLDPDRMDVDEDSGVDAEGSTDEELRARRRFLAHSQPPLSPPLPPRRPRAQLRLPGQSTIPSSHQSSNPAGGARRRRYSHETFVSSESSDSEDSVMLIEEADIESTDRVKMKTVEEKIVIKVESTATVSKSLISHAPRLTLHIPVALQFPTGSRQALCIDASSPRHSEFRNDTFVVYDGDKNPHVYKLVICVRFELSTSFRGMLTTQQSEQDYHACLSILRAVVSDYTDTEKTGTRRALHVDDPGRSSIVVCTEAEFNRMSVSQVQDVLRTKHLLVLGSNGGPFVFDDTGLESLADLWKILDVEGWFLRCWLSF